MKIFREEIQICMRKLLKKLRIDFTDLFNVICQSENLMKDGASSDSGFQRSRGA